MKQNRFNENIAEGFLREGENACCKEDAPWNPASGDGCLASWREEIKTAANEYRRQSAQASKAEGIYTEALSWERKLWMWRDNADKAHEEAVLAEAELVLLFSATVRLEENTTHTRRTVQAVLCLLKRIFERIDLLLYEVESNEESSNLLHKLKEFIRCSSKLDEQKKQAALECVATYEAKVRVINELQVSIMTKMLEILHLADLMVAYFSKGEFGLSWQLNDLRRRMKGEASSTDKADACQKGSAAKPGDKQGGQSNPPPCDPEIGKLPSDRFLLPIRRAASVEGGKNVRGESRQYYYGKLSELYEAAGKSTEDYKAQMDEARQARDQALARKNSLMEAIKAAEAAETAK
jgi:hypothetical protein